MFQAAVVRVGLGVGGPGMNAASAEPCSVAQVTISCLGALSCDARNGRTDCEVVGKAVAVATVLQGSSVPSPVSLHPVYISKIVLGFLVC